MNALYVLGGFACLAFGTYTTPIRVKAFLNSKRGILGGDIQLFGSGIMFIMIGVYLICKYI